MDEVPGLLINLPAEIADFYGLAVVTLMGCHKFNGDVAIPVVVPIHKIYNSQEDLLLAGERLAGIIRPIFISAEQLL